MGIYSTMEISRAEATKGIESALHNLENLSNDDLSELLFVLFGDKMGANFMVHDKINEEMDGWVDWEL